MDVLTAVVNRLKRRMLKCPCDAVVQETEESPLFAHDDACELCRKDFDLLNDANLL